MKELILRCCTKHSIGECIRYYNNKTKSAVRNMVRNMAKNTARSAVRNTTKSAVRNMAKSASRNTIRIKSVIRNFKVEKLFEQAFRK